MKFFIAFSLFLAAACATEWDVELIQDALNNPLTERQMKPFLEQTAPTLAPGEAREIRTAPESLGFFTRAQLEDILVSFGIGFHTPAFEKALNSIKQTNDETVEVLLPGYIILYENQSGIDGLIANSNDAEYNAYYESAKSKLTDANQKITVALPIA